MKLKNKNRILLIALFMLGCGAGRCLPQWEEFQTGYKYFGTGFYIIICSLATYFILMFHKVFKEGEKCL